MKRTTLMIILGIVLSCGFLAAETVMIFTADAWYTPERRRGEEYIIYAVEDGLMEVLFDAGHIVYNDYAAPMSQPDYTDRNRVAWRIARSGGAGWLVELEMDYTNRGEEINSLPSIIRYRFTNILTDGLGASGELRTSDYDGNPGDSPRDICQAMGTALGIKLCRSF